MYLLLFVLIDECRKGFLPDGKFEGFRSIYAQPLLRKVDKSDFEQYALSSSVGLIGLAKHSNIFGKKYEKNEMKQLTKNDAAIFVGALILKFHLVIHNRVTMIHLYNPIGPLTREDPRTSSAIKSLGFLNILSCAPNAKNCVTYDDRHLMYALHPIKKGTPLTTSMTSCIYQNYSESKRQLYNRTCKCQACTQNWLSIIDNESLNEIGQGSKPQVVSRLDYEMDKIEEELKAKAWKLNHPDIKLLSTSSKIVAESWKHFPMPSLITYNAITLMMPVYDTFYLSLILDPEKASLCVN
ncbi:hypothetical protein QAD02_001291 [Eretmocerus hayati]|uniref:Uncharacterized protein n=1 Tax=Eretmocerus hayati TaxID=131215 RepID=A0ACC2NIG2_9HYME|nr:hypothetical protein QAD02_001291 [Eretmocerus hayati]